MEVEHYDFALICAVLALIASAEISSRRTTSPFTPPGGVDGAQPNDSTCRDRVTGETNLSICRTALPSIREHERFGMNILDSIAAELGNSPIDGAVVRGRTTQPSAIIVGQIAKRAHRRPSVDRARELPGRGLELGWRLRYSEHTDDGDYKKQRAKARMQAPWLLGLWNMNVK